VLAIQGIQTGRRCTGLRIGTGRDRWKEREEAGSHGGGTETGCKRKKSPLTVPATAIRERPLAAAMALSQ